VKRTAVLIIAGALLFSASAQAASPSPRQARLAAAACFKHQGWKLEKLNDEGWLTVFAPRNVNTLWGHPWYSIRFTRAGSQEMPYGLNAREKRIAAFCRKAARR